MIAGYPQAIEFRAILFAKFIIFTGRFETELAFGIVFILHKIGLQTHTMTWDHKTPQSG